MDTVLDTHITVSRQLFTWLSPQEKEIYCRNKYVLQIIVEIIQKMVEILNEETTKMFPMYKGSFPARNGVKVKAQWVSLQKNVQNNLEKPVEVTCGAFTTCTAHS